MTKVATVLMVVTGLLAGSAVLAQQQTGQQQDEFRTTDPGFEAWYEDRDDEGIQTWTDQQREQQMQQRQQDRQQRHQDWFQDSGRTTDQQRFGTQTDGWLERQRDGQRDQWGQQQQRDQWGERRDRWGQQFGQQDFQRDQMGTRAGQTIAVVGRITQEDAQVQGIPQQNQVVELRTRRGQTLNIDLGEERNVQDLNLSRNQQIFVRGRLTNIRGQRVLLAEEVARVSQVTSIQRDRDQFGYVEPGQQDQQWRQQDQQFGQQDDWRQRDQQPRQQDQQYGQQNQWRQQNRQDW